MALVIVLMLITSPILSLWQTVLVPDPNSTANNSQLLSLLGGRYAGRFVADYVAITGSVLLMFATNTAIIGGYHVFLALTRMGFLPRFIERHNSWRRTPHVAILAATVPPVAIVYVAAQSSAGTAVFLGNLYAFGLLGSIILTNISLDVIRWQELRTDGRLMRRVVLVVGVLTTALAVIAWSVNIFAKPDATLFGGALTGAGLVIGLSTYRSARQRRPVVFPLPYRPELAAKSITAQFHRQPADVLVILPHDQVVAEAIITEGARVAAGRGAVFLYRGNRYPHQHHELLEVADPWLKDFSAHDAFARAEMIARKSIPHRRFVYVPGNLPREVVGQVWRTIYPRETVVMPEDKDMLPPASVGRIAHRRSDGVTVLHMYTSKVAPEPMRS